ncbi:MAG: DUF3108 domain-containing protein [Burkholderiaceae bacterium]|nr:DUF3108 domain-containing protein [Burkholderiaceae bacterium]
MLRHPVLWITVAVLLAHALVLQAMPLAADTEAAAPVLVFNTRTVMAPAPAAKAPASAAAVAPAVVAPPQRKGHLAPARQSATVPDAPVPSAPGGQAFAATTVVDAPTTDLGLSLAAELAAPLDLPLSTPGPDAAAGVVVSPVTQPEPVQTVAVLSGQGIVLADVATRSRQYSSREAAGSHSASAAPVHIPPPQRLEFEVVGQAKKFHYRANAELLWQHDGAHYQARQEIKVLFLGSRTQTSRGDIAAHGLRPLHFSDRSRGEQTAQFDYAQGLIHFNGDSPQAPLLPGTQDRLSIFIQLGALLAANPERYTTGTRIQIATAGGRSASPWAFRIEGSETLDLPVGSLPALKLQRLPQDANDNEQRSELWLAPSLGYLPARIQLTQNNGDFVDLRLSGHHPAQAAELASKNP